MSRNKPEPKSIFPVKHEFYDALDNFIHEAGMLSNAVKSVLDLSKSLEPSVKNILQERLDAFQRAWSKD